MSTNRFSVVLSVFAMLAIVGCGTPPTESSDQAEPSEQASTPEHVEVTAAKFKQHLEGEGVVLAKFGAPWCGPCKEVDVELDKLEATNGDKLTVVRVNVDDEPGLAEDYDVSVIPAIFLFKDGKQVNEWGIADASELQESIDEIQ